MKKLSYFFVLILLAAACNNNNQVQYKKVNPVDVDRLSPRTYLHLTCNTFVGNQNKLVIDGSIQNSSALAKYKNVIIQIFCIDSSGQIAKREQLPALDLIHPNETQSFKLITLATSNTKKVEVKLFDATGVK